MEIGFKFGLETQYMLVDKKSFKLLWCKDLNFIQLNQGSMEKEKIEKLIFGNGP